MYIYIAITDCRIITLVGYWERRSIYTATRPSIFPKLLITRSRRYLVNVTRSESIWNSIVVSHKYPARARARDV